MVIDVGKIGPKLCGESNRRNGLYAGITERSKVSSRN